MQVINYSHLFPTRYALELEGLKAVVSSETFKEPSQREESKKQIKKLLEDRYQSGKNKWFFQPLRVRVITAMFLSAFTESSYSSSFDDFNELMGGRSKLLHVYCMFTHDACLHTRDLCDFMPAYHFICMSLLVDLLVA